MRYLEEIPGLGATSIRDLRRLGVTTPQELLTHYPIRYEDYSARKTTAEIKPGEIVTIEGVMTAIAARPIRGRRLTIVEGVLSDESGSIRLTWFNQKYLVDVLRPGRRVVLAGPVELGPKGLQMTNPRYELNQSGESVHTGRIVPIYSLTGSLTQKRLRTAIAYILKSTPGVWGPNTWCQNVEAIKQIHFPDSDQALAAARRKLQFDELFLYELLHLKSRAELKKLRAPAIPAAVEAIKSFVDGLPFALTGAQRKAAWQILKDMERPEAMNRLFEGDVGSGKTVVAAIAALNAAESGYQTVLLAPTEILAEQHWQTLKHLLADTRCLGPIVDTRCLEPRHLVSIALVTSSHRGDLDADVIVGTHALLEEGVRFPKLGLVIVDEQHRFGVRQRQALQEKEIANVGVPHLLSMTATPIPRTLALTLYGDLDISVLDEMPKGRKPIKTRLVRTGKEEAMFAHLRSELDAGHQAFVVCPLIDPSDVLEAKSVTELLANLKNGPLAGYRCLMLHGRMKSEEKERIMQAFKNGEAEVLVSTTVVEVGVDVPNATVMMIEGAERFGLAQMHQLRGRVGRSDLPSFCYLRPSGFVPEKTYERLRALVDCQNGFELAERDLALRGAGELYGTEQSGFPEFKIANIFDAPLLAKARNAAFGLLKEDPELVQHPAVRQRLEGFAKRVHFE